jgi:outer membrane receptor protein involved in Fe transport
MTGLRAGYELQYASKRKTLDGTHTDGYFLSNLNLMSDVRWVKGLRASLSFYNLFNEQYQHPVADIHWQNSLGQLGRAVRFKLDYHF